MERAVAKPDQRTPLLEGADGASAVDSHASTSANQGRGSARAAFLNFFKSMFGCGVLSLPHAFEQSGLVAGIVSYVLIAAVCTYTMQLVIRCKHMLQPPSTLGGHARGLGNKSLVTFGEVAGHVFGVWGKRFVDFQLVLLELLFNAGFLIVMSSTLHELIPSCSQLGWTLALFVPVAALSCIRWLRDFWFLSLLGLFIYIVGVMGVTYYHGAERLSSDRANEFSYRNAIWPTLPLFCGTAMYSLEGVLMALPTAASMRDERDAEAVIGWGMAGVCFFFCTFGAFGYAVGFGSCDIILSCLPDGPLTTAVRSSLVLSLLVSSPIQVYVISESVEPMLSRAQAPQRPPLATTPEEMTPMSAAPSRWGVVILRVSIVALTSIVSVLVPDFSTFTDIVGNFFQPIIGFMFPPVLFFGVRHQLRQRGLEHLSAGQSTSSPQKCGEQHGWWRAQCTDGAGAFAVTVFLLGFFAIVVGMQSTVRKLQGKN